MEHENVQRDEPWLDEIGHSYTRIAAEKAVTKIGKDIAKNGELTGAIATATAWVPVIGQVVAIAASIVSITQMLATAKKMAILNEYLRLNGTLTAGYVGDFNEEHLTGSLALERLKDELYYLQEVKKAYGKTILISSGLVLTSFAIIYFTRKK